MVMLIAGASHTGKTLLAQKLVERHRFPCLSIDHLKMGLIRSGQTFLTPLSDDEALTAYLWPIVREMVKTAVENKQNLIVEGCYIPCNWKQDFDERYLPHIKGLFLIMSENYLRRHFDQVLAFENVVEQRLADDSFTQESSLQENRKLLSECLQNKTDHLLIDSDYHVDFPI
ncbi:MAG: adenylate kinase [Clostridia bacterium]|nr:adenylate kinase [Clostridia bacterium]